VKIIIIPNSPVMAARHYCLANTLVDQGHEVHYFMWALPFRVNARELLHHMTTSLIPKTYQYERFTMHKVSRLPYFWPVINGWIFKFQLRRLFKQLDADIVFAESYTNETEVPRDIPFIYDLADDYAAPAQVYGGLVYRLAFKLLGVSSVMRRQCENALAVTAVSEALCEYARPYNETVIKLPNGVDAELMRQILKDGSTYPANNHSMVYMTRFGEWSRVIETLQAVTELRKEFPDVEITLIGEGSETPKILDYIRENRAKNYIHYLGFVYDRKKLLRRMNSSAIGLNISDKNRWRDAAHPIKVVEYSAFGKTVVSTDLSEVKALRLPNVLMFSDKGRNDLKSVMKRALKRSKGYEDYLSMSNRILRDYDWHGITNRLVRLISASKEQQIVAETPAAAMRSAENQS
jgi:glycosyltransferase involved in cell wall biosynthesis